MRDQEPSLTGGAEKALLGVIATAATVVLVVLTGGGLAGLLTGHGWAFPGVQDWVTTVGGVLGHASDPGAGYPAPLADQIPTASVFWAVVGGLFVLVLLVGTLATIGALVRRTPPGMTTRTAAKKAMTGPDRTKPFARYAGVPLSMMTGDAGLVVAPQQSGKTTRLAAPAIVDAPGPAVATSTKADLVDLTIYARQQLHPESSVHVFDADRITGLANTQWCPVRGCEDPEVAQVRAAAMVAARPLGTGGSSVFFTEACTLVLRCLLHAAAVGDLDLMAVRAWVQDPRDDRPYRLLDSSPHVQGWSMDLRSTAQTADSRSAGNVNLTLNQILSPLGMPAVAAQVTPRPGEGFSIDDFLARPADTLYVMSSGTSGGTSPIATALVASLVHTAKQVSQTTPTRKLDPIVRVVLDEVANGCPLPALDELLADGGGRGINTLAFVQAFAQLEDRWASKAGIIWGAPSIRILLGGCGETEWLRKVSDLLGTKRTTRRQVSRGGRSGGSVSYSTERGPVLSIDEISTLQPGKALLLYRGAVRAVVDVDGYWQRPDHQLFDDSLRQAQVATGRRPAVDDSQRRHRWGRRPVPAPPSAIRDASSDAAGRTSTVEHGWTTAAERVAADAGSADPTAGS